MQNYCIAYKVIKSHLDHNFSKVKILLINYCNALNILVICKILINYCNALNILVICKRTFPKEKTFIIDMLRYLIYIKKYENTFYNIRHAKLKI